MFALTNLTYQSGLEHGNRDISLHENQSFCNFVPAAERPIKFLQELKNIQVQEGNGVTLCCELSKPGTLVQWKKGDKVLTNGEKYQMKQSGCTVELLIRKSQPEDSGTYSCGCDDIETTATIIITGES